MKRLNLSICLCIMFCSTAVGIDYQLTLDSPGKYIWRGQNLNDDPVFQQEFSAGHEGLTAYIWGNLDLTDINGSKGDYSEYDLTLDYTDKLPWFTGIDYVIGLSYYDFPGTKAPDTAEFFWGLSFDLPLNPALTFYHDLDEAEGTYVSLGISHLTKNFAQIADIPVGLELGAKIGYASGSYNKFYWGTDQSKFNDLGLTVAAPMEIAGLTITPYLSYITLLSDDIRTTDAYSTDSDFLVGGVMLVHKF